MGASFPLALQCRLDLTEDAPGISATILVGLPQFVALAADAVFPVLVDIHCTHRSPFPFTGPPAAGRTAYHATLAWLLQSRHPMSWLWCWLWYNHQSQPQPQQPPVTTLILASPVKPRVDNPCLLGRAQNRLWGSLYI